jgi:hypothetical protein
VIEEICLYRFLANICEIVGSEEGGKFIRLDRRLRGPGGRGFCLSFILKMFFFLFRNNLIKPALQVSFRNISLY